MSPIEPKPPDVPTEVAELSPAFVEIYRQAAAAEAYRLGDIAGAGYRKALEFLIKDYCISGNETKAGDIRKQQLGPVIATHVDDPRIKDCARRASWLGNDETHYERRWESKDITDLKRLIQLTVNWIHSAALTEKYKTEMPEE